MHNSYYFLKTSKTQIHNMSQNFFNCVFRQDIPPCFHRVSKQQIVKPYYGWPGPGFWSCCYSQYRGADRFRSYDLQIANCKAAFGGNLLCKNTMKNLLLKIQIKVGIYVHKWERVLSVHRLVYRYDSTAHIHCL